MSQPNSLHLDLLQCTGVTPAPAVASPRLPIKHPLHESVKQGRSCLPAEARHPLHDSNSQTPPCGNSSQKRSHTTSQSIIITPSEKRQTMLALSPERPLPAGQQWTTLEVQRVLSLTPGTKLAFRRLPNQPGSLDSMPDGQTHGSNTSCSPANTVPDHLSSASCHGANTSRQHMATPHCSPGKQPADPQHMPHQTCSATEPQLADFPATQLAGGATALDLLLCQATQVVGVNATAADTFQPELAVISNRSLAQPALHHASELLLNLKQAEALGSTPMLQLGMGRDAEAVTHDRAPAGPSAQCPEGEQFEQAGAGVHTKSADASKQSADRGHDTAPTDAAAAAVAAGHQQRGPGVNLPLSSAQDDKQHESVPMRSVVPDDSQPGTGLDLDTAATDGETQEASQVSIMEASCQ